jgi:hypothetical protein
MHTHNTIHAHIRAGTYTYAPTRNTYVHSRSFIRSVSPPCATNVVCPHVKQNGVRNNHHVFTGQAKWCAQHSPCAHRSSKVVCTTTPMCSQVKHNDVFARLPVEQRWPCWSMLTFNLSDTPDTNCQFTPFLQQLFEQVSARKRW